ncbi:hypothetical protein A8B74_03680 [Sulfitobacter geojensis]|jgi:hypothetical protein|nr:hypothetical protein A8B82_23305 [Sulfitobacter sp. EhC04]OAN89676.1 hypothetical protein A8B74_03680 [Sulfitobacter geojensis]|tara:strand:+ start:303 stop:629 length:327 start_codon:yes stop_codon:yes gene_type:complete
MLGWVMAVPERWGFLRQHFWGFFDPAFTKWQVRAGVYLERAAAGSTKVGSTKLVGQPDDTQTAPVALFGVLTITHDSLCEVGDIRPDTIRLRMSVDDTTFQMEAAMTT